MDIFIDKHSGYKFCMKMNNECANHILNHGIFEYDTIMNMKKYLNNNLNLIDIGAHMGTYSVILSPYCKHVYAFEAQNSTYQCLNNSITANNRDNITTYNCALSSNNGEKTLYQVSEDGGGSTLNKDLIHGKILNSEIVESKKLDDFNLLDIGLIKIDVEGHEEDVLRGAEETIKNNNYPPILFEAWPDEWYMIKKKELFDYILSLGYRIYPVTNTNNMFLAKI